MKIVLENIGVFRYAEYETSDLTIIAGKNNTGKTYATYTLYSFLDYFWNGYLLTVSSQWISSLMENGSVSINLNIGQEEIDRCLREACNQFIPFLPRVFAAQEKYFSNSRLSISVSREELRIPDTFDRSFKTEKNEVLQIEKTSDTNELFVTLLLSSDGGDSFSQSMRGFLSRILGDTYKEVLFKGVFGDCFLASAERTGAVIFKDELNVQKNTLLREVISSDTINIQSIVSKMYSFSYALPVRRDIDFIRNLDSITKIESDLSKAHPELIKEFDEIVGGVYKVSKESIYFIPNRTRGVKLTIGESASSVRSLLDLYFYLKHIAKQGQLLMIDEPELNLHPDSQRRMAKLLAKLVNYGIKVFVTTHSDYIIKELNTLIMFKARGSDNGIATAMRRYGYSPEETLYASQIKMYMSVMKPVLLAGNSRRVSIQTLSPADVNPVYGIEANSFDNTINEMNSIQELLLFGRNGHHES